MHFTLESTRIGLRNSTTRIPFRYGRACLTRCPQALVEVTIRSGVSEARGYGGDCLPPSWFDKSPERTYREQVRDMIASVVAARDAFRRALSRPRELFPAWREVVQGAGRLGSSGRGGLLAGLGTSLVERALLDALTRLAGVSLAEALRRDLFGIRPGEIHEDLRGHGPADWLPPRPLEEISVRHTVGLTDPLTPSDAEEGDRPDDGLPVDLEEYLARHGVRYLKVKLSGDPDRDHDRLLAIAAISGRHLPGGCRLTLDGNEQFASATDLLDLFERLRSDARLETLLSGTLAIEQPLDRSVALDPGHAAGVRELGRQWPVIIDESDDSVDAFARARAVGYRGVTSKGCKGPIKALLNAGLVWLANGRGARNDHILTGEDLCCVGVVPVQSDLAMAASLGIEHVERNGHHYHPGLSYLTAAEREGALREHPDLYVRIGNLVVPRLEDGRFRIGSLHRPGCGFSAMPDFEATTPVEEWEFDSLGLEE